jgi:hypothetical protein
MKKTLIYWMLFLISTQSLTAQVIKTFKQDYNDGTMIYHYYENPETNEQVKQGAFSYTKYLKANPGIYSEIVTGQFRNGYRDGVWSFTIRRIDYPNSGGSYTTETTLSKQSFKNGVPNGLWNVSVFWKLRNQVYFKGAYVWGAFDPSHTETASLTFNNGIATGVVTHSDPKLITLHLNKNGFVVGNYIFPGAYSNSEITFNGNGIVIKFVERDKSGRVESKLNFDNALIQTGENYLAGKISKQQLDEQQIKIDTVKISNYANYSDVFEQDYFIFPTLGGDKSIFDNGTTTINNRVYGRYIFLERIK